MLSRRSSLALIIVTLAAVAAAVAVVLGERDSNRAADRAALFPGIEQEFDRVTEIEIADRDGAVVIRRAGDEQWVLPDKHDYPADRAMVRRLILSFGRMTVIEPKTRQPELHDRLGLGDIDNEKSRARRVTLRGGDKEVASLLVGDRAASSAPGGSTSGGERAYVRRPGEAATWLVDHVPDISAKQSEWMDDRLFTLQKERIAEIVVRHDNGEELRLARDKAEDDFTLDQLPKGRKLKTYGGPEALASSLAFLSFDDVRPAGDEDEAETARVTFRTFDGLTVTLGIQGNWVRFAAEGEGPEATDINERLGRWRFELSDYKIRDLTPMLDQLLAPENEKAS